MIDVLSIINLVKEHVSENKLYVCDDNVNDMLNDFLIEDEDIIEENVEILTKLVENSLERRYKITFEFRSLGGRGGVCVVVEGIKILDLN